MAFGENQCRGRANNAALNFAILRRIVMNLLRQDCTTNVGLKIVACWPAQTIAISLNSWAKKKFEHLNLHEMALVGFQADRNF